MRTIAKTTSQRKHEDGSSRTHMTVTVSATGADKNPALNPTAPIQRLRQCVSTSNTNKWSLD